jgi:hypothetical protein
MAIGGFLTNTVSDHSISNYSTTGNINMDNGSENEHTFYQQMQTMLDKLVQFMEEKNAQ